MTVFEPPKAALRLKGMVVSVAVALSLLGGRPVAPLIQVGLDGTVSAGGARVRVLPGTRFVQTPFGTGVDLDGINGGILVEDAPRFHLTRRFTVSTWVNLRRYQTGANGTQLLFRGDDRNGLDPYHLTVGGDGTVALVVEPSYGVTEVVSAPIPLQTWVHVLASFDGDQGRMALYLDGVLVRTRTTPHRPFRDLDPAFGPGIGIGNVQRPDAGIHRQPTDGVLADLRLYDRVLTPPDVDYVRQSAATVTKICRD